MNNTDKAAILNPLYINIFQTQFQTSQSDHSHTWLYKFIIYIYYDSLCITYEIMMILYTLHSIKVCVKSSSSVVGGTSKC